MHGFISTDMKRSKAQLIQLGGYLGAFLLSKFKDKIFTRNIFRNNVIVVLFIH